MTKSNFLKKLGLCALSAALCTAAFASCGKDDDGDGNKLGENTDISAVESEKVSDEAAWKAAIDVTKFTNFSMKTSSKRTVAAKTTQNALTYLYTGEKAYYSEVETNAENKTSRNDVYLAKSGNDYSVYGISYENGEKVHEGAYDKNNSGEYEYMMTGVVGTAFLSQLSQIPFSKISYSEEKKGYVYAEEGQGEAVLKVVNGLFAGYVSESTFTSGEETVVMEMSAVYYNIGTTEITLPENMNKPADDSGASAEITAEEFFVELKKREDASIAAKKWGTVNVAGTLVRDGVSVNVNQKNLAIRHTQNGSSIGVSYSANYTVSVPMFRYSALKNGIPSTAIQKYEKDGANLKSTWIMTIDDQTQTIKVTYDADGYVIDYDYDDGSRVQKLTLSGYAGEYKLSDSGKQPGGDDTTNAISKKDFIGELKKREAATEEAKKWGTVNVEGSIIAEGIEKNIKTTAEVVAFQGQIGIIVSEEDGIWLMTFGYSEMVEYFSDGTYEKNGDILIFEGTHVIDGENQRVKMTFDADGYLIEFEASVIDSASKASYPMKLTFSGYAGEFVDDTGAVSGDDTLADKEITVDEFVDKIALLQEKAVAYTTVTVNTASETYENAEISDGEVVCGEGDDALQLPISVEKIQEFINEMKTLEAKISVRVRSVEEDENYDLMIEFSDITIKYSFGSNGYLTSCSNIVGNEEITVAHLFDYQK